MEKINIAELLKDCPKGMELDCTAFNNVKFQCADNDGIWIEYIDSDNHDRVIYLTCDGGIKIKNIETKCVIFPKGKTTWEGFVPPCNFKDGDIVFTRTGNYDWVSIFKQVSGKSFCTHIDLCINDNDLLSSHSLCNIEDITTQRIATAEEKQKLFLAIKDNGYKWNEETKTLEKLTPNKFDINTLVPFESRVLMRSSNAREWVATFYSHYSNNKFYGCGMCCDQCIPYEGNQHLLGTTDDCDEYFKTWE